MKTLPFLAFFLFLGVSALGLTAPADTLDWTSAPSVDLTSLSAEADGLPLLAVELHDLAVRPSWTGYIAGLPSLVFDFDGDGIDEFLFSSVESIQLANMDPRSLKQVHDQVNPPPRFKGRATGSLPVGAGFCLKGPFDLDGDGNLEFVAWGATADLREWGFWTVEVRHSNGRFTLHREAEFFLGSHPERRPDDKWDGRYAVIGAVPGLLPEPTRLALILTVNVGFDGYGRGVLAVDPYTGQTLWAFHCGPNPNPLQAAVADLDGDGAREIAFVGGGGENLNGELVGNTTDDHTRLFVLDDQGREKWSYRLCGPRSMGHLAIADLDPHPGCELVTATLVAGLVETNLRVHDATGNLLQQTYLTETPTGLLASPAGSAREAGVYLTTSSGLVLDFRRQSRGLDLVRTARLADRATLPSHAVFAAEPRTRLFVRETSSTTHLLDGDLRPLASFFGEGRHALSDFSLIRNGGREFLPGLSYDSRGGWEILPNPHALPTHPVLRQLARTPAWARALVGLAALLLVGWNLPAVRSRRAAAHRPSSPSHGEEHLRAARLHLLEDLELSGHGAIAPLRSLRRLLWLLDALKTGIDISEGLTTRLREIWTDCHRDDLPRLLTILERARDAGVDHPSLLAATAALDNIQGQLADLKEHGFAPELLDGASGRLHGEESVAENALQNLRREIGMHFTCDLEQSVAKVLRAHQETLTSLGIVVEAGQAATAQAGGADPFPAPEKLHCRMDPGELEFILDNLVGNACRAMEGSSRRQLRLTWQAANGMVKLLASDTGIGIATEDRELILHTRYTSKQGGGLGLPRSVSILRKYGGDLGIPSSTPGRGTTFQLLLPRATPPGESALSR